MFKLAKMILWIKGHGTAISIVGTIVLAIGAGISNHRANKWEREALRLDGKLTEQKKDQDRYYGEVAKSRAKRRIKEAAEVKLREELEGQIQAAKEEGEKAKRALAEEKKKTTLLPPSELVEEVAARIGDELTLTGDRLYLFTRTGTERTLDKFKDGEFYLSEFNRHLGIIKDHETKAESFNTSLALCEEAAAENLTGWNDCRETLATAIESKEADRKALKAGALIGKAKAFAAGGLFVFVIDKIFGIF